MGNQDEMLTVDQAIDHDIKMGEALNRLRSNPDFKTLILDGYLDGKVKASVSLLAVPQIKARGERADIMEDLIAASNLGFFFKMIDDKYEGAKDPILSDQELAEQEAAIAGE